MTKTPKIINLGTEHWIEYTGPDQEPNGSWKVTVTGKIRLTERRIVLETKTKNAWGKTSELALQGGMRLAGGMIERIIRSIDACRGWGDNEPR